MLLGRIVFAIGILVGIVAVVLLRRDRSEIGSKWLAASLGVTGLGALLVGLLGD